MEERIVYKVWNSKCENGSDTDRLNVQVSEMSEWGDKYVYTFIYKVEC